MNIYSSEKKTIFPSLAENIPCDVLVIGGGASGLLCASGYQVPNRWTGLPVVSGLRAVFSAVWQEQDGDV